MPTMADVARRADVALSTVSHALSGKRPVSTETKQRILQAMADLDYQPHALARGLATRHSGIVVLLLPPALRGLFEAQFIFVASLAETVRQMGYSLLLWTAPRDDLEILRMVQQGIIEGVVLMEITMHDPRIDILREHNIPLSIIGRREHNDGISLVDLDFEQAMNTCVSHLADLGHQYIGLVTYDSKLLDLEYGPAVRTLSGFKQAIATRPLKGAVRASAPTSQAGYEETRDLLTKHPSISAVVAATESVLEGVVQAIRDQGLRIPENFSVLAVSPAHFAQLATLGVTAVDFPMADMGRIGAEMLIRQLTGASPAPQQIILQPGLTVRGSTGPCNLQKYPAGRR
jgi:DNA-binding LacI/PurR family transcriptional regulator